MMASSSSHTLPDRGPLVVGVDVGGTKIAAGVVDTQGQVYGRVKLPTDTTRPEMTLQSIATGVISAIKAAQVSLEQISGVGLGIPGKVDAENGIGVLAVNLGWQDVPVKSWLEKALGLPCTIENDVGAAALGESLYGAGRGMANQVYLSLGTGIAARVISEGKLYRGAHGLAGEIGHAVFEPGGPLCSCGARGCLEALASGPALVRQAQEAIQAGQTSLLRDAFAHNLVPGAELVFEAAARGDRLAQRILSKAGSHLAYAIYLLAMAFDPQVVVLGGGLAQTEGLLIESIQSGVAYWRTQSPIFRQILAPDAVRVTSLKQDVAILGAAALVTGGRVAGGGGPTGRGGPGRP
jgi:glucokinase